MRFVDKGQVFDTETAELVHDTGIRFYAWPVADRYWYARHLYYRRPIDAKKSYCFEFFKIEEQWDVPGAIRRLFGAEKKRVSWEGKGFALFMDFSFDLQEKERDPELAANTVARVAWPGAQLC